MRHPYRSSGSPSAGQIHSTASPSGWHIPNRIYLLRRIFNKVLRVAADKCYRIGMAFQRRRALRLTRCASVLAAGFDFANSSVRGSGDGPFNGQMGRVNIFHALLDACEISCIVETGTYRGATTGYMAKYFNERIYSCELNPRYFYYAKWRLASFTNVTLLLVDSRYFLAGLLQRRLLQGKSVFFYLDSHWYRDLPLRGEVSLILSYHNSAVVMIDDFQVPFDGDYGYDVFGPCGRLCLSILSAFRAKMNALYFPATPGKDETGAKRGCVVFTNSPSLAQKLATITVLRPATDSDWNLYM